MINAGKLLILIGFVLALVGVILWALGRAGFRGLPGDITYESDRVRVYFPIVTMLVLSALLTLLMWFWIWITRR